MNPNLIISTIEDRFFIPIENRKNHWPVLLWWAELQPVSRLDMPHSREFQELPASRDNLCLILCYAWESSIEVMATPR